MRVALVYPPFADATQPYASLPALAAFLRMRGNHEVCVYDANLEFCLELWTKKRLNLAARRIEGRLRKMEEGPGISTTAAQEYSSLMMAVLKAPHVAARIEEAIRNLRRWETFASLQQLAAAKRVLQEAAEVLGAESPLLRRRVASLSAADISRLTRSPSCNPFGGFLERITVPQLCRARPGAVGISITYAGQIVPAVALARAVRRRLPSAAVIFGGQIATVWYDDLQAYPEIFDWCDYVVGYEGETALDALLTAIESGTDTSRVANVARRDGNRVRQGPVFVENINELPTPDYSGLPLDRYVAPEPVFLVNASRGCYWSRCTFCSVSPAMRRQFRMRNPDLLVRDLLSLRDCYSTHCITLADDCVPPAILRALARRLVGSGLAWQCEVRFERALTRSLLTELVAAGCKNLIFGLESYSECVLGRMQKGVSVDVIEPILQHCREAGLAFNLQLFFGFPGETEAQAKQTLEFVAGQLHGAATLSFGQFSLQRGSAIAHDPSAFGVTIKSAPRTLGTDVPYTPVASHASATEKQLADRVLQEAGLRNLPLSIDAHTLLYLYKSGVQAMANSYYVPRTEGSAAPLRASQKLKKRSSQSLRRFCDWENGDSTRLILYDYERDRTVELSQLAGWILCELTESMSTEDLITCAAARSQLQALEVESAVTSAISELHQARLLEEERCFASGRSM